jgi:hypothetical protein
MAAGRIIRALPHQGSRKAGSAALGSATKKRIWGYGLCASAMRNVLSVWAKALASKSERRSGPWFSTTTRCKHFLKSRTLRSAMR